MLAVVVCAAIGYYTNLQTRERAKLIEGYVQEFHETDRTGAQWHTRLAQLGALSGTSDTDWVPLALSNLLSLTAIVLAWVFAEASSRGELMGGFTTMAGIGFSVHSVVRNMRAQRSTVSGWEKLSTPLSEVSRGDRKAA
jgi:hypothetical protein